MLMPLDPHIQERLFSRRRRSLLPASGMNESPPQVHLVGASGAGMTALSEILMDFGWALSGSDLNVVSNDDVSSMSASKHGRILKIHQGHDSAHLPATADLVIFSPAISDDNPELTAARQMKIPTASYVEFLSELLNQSTGICIAGTHGKTTTSAMTASILREAGIVSSAVIGGEVIQYGRSGWGHVGNPTANESDSLLVVEGESERRFRFLIGIDQHYPMQAAQSQLSPVVPIQTAAGPPTNGSTGWFYHVNANCVQVTHLSGLMNEPIDPSHAASSHNESLADSDPCDDDGENPTGENPIGEDSVSEKGASEQAVATSATASAPDRPGFALRLQETEGRYQTVHVEMFRNPSNARVRDFRGQTVTDVSPSGDGVLVDLSPFGIAEVEVFFD